ncbi:bcl-2-related ovarian killer protein-like isoform X2 [Amphiura filiformis]|uniref:bcl-2-related ovarian killer protein-like isoform X2 n=1 Tax=Amphiura filiformis TaxID=82378 RepID=UPI003B226513
MASLSYNRLRLPGVTSEGEITEQAMILCKEYIQNKLKRAGLLSTNDLKSRFMKISEVSRELQFIGLELEQLYPTLFKDVCRQLNVNLSSETVADEVFTEVAAELFASGITWARVVAMFSVAGSIAVECFQQGNVTYINTIVNSLANFVRNHLALWISQQGGWNNLVRSFRQKNNSQMLWTVSLVGAVCGIAGTLMATSGGKL